MEGEGHPALRTACEDQRSIWQPGVLGFEQRRAPCGQTVEAGGVREPCGALRAQGGTEHWPGLKSLRSSWGEGTCGTNPCHYGYREAEGGISDRRAEVVGDSLMPLTRSYGYGAIGAIAPF